MKASRAQIERALDTPSPEIRLFLLYGPDESQSRDLAARLARRQGPDAERVDLSGAALKADPARLADEAASISLFGGPRHIRVEPAGDETIDAVEALLEAGSAGNPVAIVAGALRKDSRLLKRALADPAAMAFASYLPEGNDGDRLAIAIGRDHGLRIDRDIAARLAGTTGGDRALLAREIEKFALFVDAIPNRPVDLGEEAFDRLAAGHGEGDLSRLVDAVLSGRGEQAAAEITHLAVEGIDGIALLRPLLRRLVQLASLRARVETGDSVESVMGTAGRGIFWKDRDAISSQIARWSAARLATAIDRVMRVELAVKSSGGAGTVLVEAELLLIARQAARLR